MSPRLSFPLDAEGHLRFHEMLGRVRMQFLERGREEMTAFGYDPVLVVIYGELVSRHGRFPQCELRSGGGEHKFVLHVRGRGSTIAAVIEDLACAFAGHLLDTNQKVSANESVERMAACGTRLEIRASRVRRHRSPPRWAT
jgi:hypothetical protein